MRTGIETGFLLDQLWHLLRGEMDRSKEPALLLVGRIFSDAGIRYAIISRVALQIHQPEPRTTLDIDLAVLSRSAIPRARLEAAGFAFTAQFTPASENWLGPGDTPVQLTDDPALAGAISRAEEIDIGGVRLRIIGRADLLHEKLRAASDPARRRSKRLQDFADAHALIEAFPGAVDGLSAEEARPPGRATGFMSLGGADTRHAELAGYRRPAPGNEGAVSPREPGGALPREELRHRAVERVRRLEVGEVADAGDHEVARAGNRVGHEAMDLHAGLVVLAQQSRASAPTARAAAAPAGRCWVAWSEPHGRCAQDREPGGS